MKKRFAVIGYGGQGAWHCEQILKSDVAALTGIYDIAPKRVAAALEKQIHVYSTVEELLGDETVEAVVIAVPNDHHNVLTKLALQAGKHVICEKPVEMSVAAFDEMAECARQTGKLFTVHQNRRFDVDYLAIKGIVESGELGEPICIESRVHGSRGIPSDWRGEKIHGGGMILDWGVHLIDQMLQILRGTVIRVYCTTTHITNQEVDDGFKLRLEFDDHTSAHIEVGTYNFISMPRFYMQCQKGSAMITDWRQRAKVARMKAWNEKEILPVQTAAGITKTMAPRDELTLDEYEVDRPQSDVHDFYRNFCAAMDGREAPMVQLDQVRRVMQVMEAAFASNAACQVIEVQI